MLGSFGQIVRWVKHVPWLGHLLRLHMVEAHGTGIEFEQLQFTMCWVCTAMDVEISDYFGGVPRCHRR